MHNPTRLLTVGLAVALLAGCAHVAPSATPAAGALVAAQATAKGRDKACAQFIAEYQGLSWDYSKDKKQALLDMIAATGGGLAVTPLTTEYQGLSWDYSKDRKTLLMAAISRLSQVASQPCSQGMSTTMQDQICQTFLTEYQGLSWDYSADRKKLLMDAVANTGSDKALEAFTTEYQGLSWDYSKDRKQLLLGVLARLLGSATPCNSAEDVMEKAKPAKKLSAARQHLANVLQKELDQVPAAHRDAVKALLAKL
ncbi:MAG: hypothetical protein JWM80_71 [Cyanobacteria bacterium RYN_339]|nr:hypothetical protein [Cyanobacteria bacterium RYN_339]